MSMGNHRYKAIDGMRGIAALAVVLYHLSGNLKTELSQVLPEFINRLFSFGYLGVPVFFVISGLVISLSIGSNQITGQYAANFILRRSLRLDPTYWAAIFFGLLLLLIKNRVTATPDALPSAGNVVAHMFYLQDILSVSPLISVVFWTLCLEVQFYLFYLFSLWLAQRINVRGDRYLVHMLILMAIGIYSILLDRNLLSISIPGLFFSNWHYFLMGVLVGNAIRHLSSSGVLLFSWLVLEMASCAYFTIKPYQLAGIVSSLIIYLLWRQNLMGSVFTSSPLQYLGKISYTLYLLHPDIGWKVISFGRNFLHGHLSSAVVLLLFTLSIAVSIVFAHIFHVAFERPSLRLSNRLKGKSINDIFGKVFGLRGAS